MLTQYLENAKAGDRPGWLIPLLSAPITRWEAFNLHQNFEAELVARIRAEEATLLDYRNYLFTRKARLMSHLHRSDELAKCAYAYVSSSFNELRGLTNISMIGLRTWAILASLEAYFVLETAAAVLNKSGDTLTIHSASILELARGHLFKLGCRLGLVSGTPDEGAIGDVINGFQPMGAESDEAFDENDNNPAEWRRKTGTFAPPVDVLKGALASADQFEHHYLEISLKTIETFKKIKRDRTASVVGGELAKFHLARGNFNQAEDLLLELVEIYKADEWQPLVDSVHERLVELYTNSQKTHKLAKVYFGMINRDRPEVFDKFYATLEGDYEQRVGGEERVGRDEVMRFQLEQVALPLTAQCSPSSRIDIDEELKVKVELECHIPLGNVRAEIWLDEVVEKDPTGANFSVVSHSIASNSMVDVFSVGRETIATNTTNTSAPFSSSASAFATSARNSSGATSDSDGGGLMVHNNQIRFANHSEVAKSPELRYSLQTDARTRKPRSSGISSPSVRILRHKQLKRETKSSTNIDLVEAALIRPALVSTSPTQLNLRPGVNEIEFLLDSSRPGRFAISRFCLFYEVTCAGSSKTRRVELVSQTLDPCVHIEVLDTAPVVTMLHDERLFTGIEGALNFNILVGSRPINDETIRFEMTKGLELISSCIMAQVKHYSYRDGIRRNSTKYDSSTRYELQVNRLRPQNALEIRLPRAQPRCEISFTLLLRSPLQVELDLRAASESDSSIGDLDDFLCEPSSASLSKTHQIWARLGSLLDKHTFQVQFFNPFEFRTLVKGNLVALTMKNICPVRWTIRTCQCMCPAVMPGPLKALTPELSDIELSGGQSVTLSWTSLPSMIRLPTNVELVWQFHFECQNISTDYEFADESGSHKPLYSVNNLAQNINPDTGLVPLTIEVRKVDLSGENEQLAWHIADTRSAWAICGRTSGVLEFDRGQDVQSISVDLMPLFIGRLRLPQVDLKRLSSATSATASEHDSSLSSLDSPHYKGRKKTAFDFGEIELENPLTQVAQT